MTTLSIPSAPSLEAAPEPVLRHIRLRLPNSTYKALRHRLVDADPTASISDLIVELLDQALAVEHGT